MLKLMVGCLLMLHAPDGSKLFIEGEAIQAIKPVDAKYHDHLVKGTKTVLYTAAKVNGFGVAESVSDVVMLLEQCGRK